MNLFESSYLTTALFAGFIVSLVVNAFTVTFDKFFSTENRVKLFVFFAAIVAAIITIDFDFDDWQKFATKVLIQVSFAVLFYHYLGGKFIRGLFEKVKKMLPGYSEKKQ